MVEWSKYYLVDLYKRHCSIQLFENKELQPDEYSSTFNFTRFYVQKLVEDKDQFCFSQANIVIPYQYYSLYSIECRGVNDYSVDGFNYDPLKKLILYGTTKIYAYKKGDCFYEVLTGIEISNMEAHSIQEIKYVSDLRRMRKDLSCVQNHFDLYKYTLQDVFDKLALSYQNYVEAYDQFNELQQLYLERIRHELLISKIYKEMQRLESEKDLLTVERENVKKMILDIQKSSLI